MEKGIKEMIRVAKKNALFCIVVPNVNYLFWKISGSKGTKQQEIIENLLSLNQWKYFFIKQGLEIQNIYQDRWFMKKNIFQSINPLRIIKNTIYKLIWIFLPLYYAYQFIFILKHA